MNNRATMKASRFPVIFWASKITELLLLILMLVLTVKAFLFLVWAISQRDPLDVREHMDVLTTGLFLNGRSPFSIESQPQFMNMYGALYGWSVYPVAKLFGNSFMVHRIMSALYLVASCGVLFKLLRSSSISRRDSAVASFFFFSAHVASFYTITARPDSLGMLLCLLSIWSVVRFRSSATGLVASAFFSLLAYFAKPYFLLAVPGVALYVFLFESKKKGILFFFGFLTAFVGSLLFITQFYETYIINTIITNFCAHSFGNWHQLRVVGPGFLYLYAGFISLAIWAGSYGLFRGWDKARQLAGIRILLQDWDRPFIGGFRAELSTVLFFYTAALMIFLFGQHSGNGLPYYLEIFLPFLIWFSLRAPARYFSQGKLIGKNILICVNLYAVLFFQLPAIPRQSTVAWDEMRTLIRDHKNVFHTESVAHILYWLGRPIFDSGHTQYYKYPYGHGWGVTMDRYYQRCEEFNKQLIRSTDRREFDLIVVRQYEVLQRDIIEKNYNLIRQMHLPFGSDVVDLDIWEQKP